MKNLPMQTRKLTSRIALVIALASPLLVSVAGVQLCTSSSAVLAGVLKANDFSRLSDLRADVALLPDQARPAFLARHGFQTAADLDGRVAKSKSEALEMSQESQYPTFLMLMTMLAALVSSCVASGILFRKL
jgi:hypothetical protein